MSQLRYTLNRTGGSVIYAGSYIASVSLLPGTHTAEMTPTAQISVAVNASAQVTEGWDLTYMIDGVNQTPGGPISKRGNNQGTANYAERRPFIL